MFRKTKLATELLLAFGGATLAFSGPAFAQEETTSDTVTQQPAKGAASLERVEITGSSIRRIDAQSALPVQIITREEIAKTGANTVEQLMKTISSNSSSGGFATSSASGATTGGLSSVSLHGLTSVRTLVLVNGRRLSPYGIGFTGDSTSVDINSIPLAAVERVEVLKDGASAIYGSDAIAGVINFILQKNLQGGEISAEYGDTSRRDANFQRLTGKYGYGDFDTNGFNAMIVGSYQKEGALYGRDRTYANSAIDVKHGNDTTSGNTFPGNVASNDPNVNVVGNPSFPDCPAPYATNDPLLSGGVNCRFDPAPLVALLPDAERYSVYGTAKVRFAEDIEGYAEAGWNRNRIHTQIQPVPLSDQFALPDSNPLFGLDPYNGFATVLLRPSSPFYPTAFVVGQTGGATPDLLVRYRDSLNGNRDLTDVSETPRVVVGTRGTVEGFDFDVAGLYTESKLREQVNNGYPLYTEILPLLNSGNVNFFGDNSDDIVAAAKDAEFTGNAFHIKTSIASLAARASKELVQLPGGGLALGLGAETRKEKYKFTAPEAIQTGDVSGYGGNFLNNSKDRDVKAVFAELNVPIIKELELNGAVRYDDYQGTGHSYTPKGSLRYRPIKQLLLRGSISRGFRAPSLQENFLPQTIGVSTNGLSDPLRCASTNSSKDCNTQFGTLNGGNEDLKPEKSKNWTGGIVIEPIEELTMAFDYFRVNLRQTITTSVDPAIILENAASVAKYASFITRAAQTPADIAANRPGQILSIDQRFTNLGQTKVRGVDIDLKYRFPTTDFGRFTAGLDGTYFIKFDTQNPDGTFTGGVDQVNTATGGVVPRWKSYQTLGYAYGPFDAQLAINYQKGYHDTPGNVTGAERDVSSYTTFDLQASYNVLKGFRLTGGIINLFDRDPPYSNIGAQFQSGYDIQYGDPRGRYVYLRGAYSF